MSQNDFTIANQGFPAFRSDLNSALQALATNNSGTSAPSTTFANMWWYDSTNNIMYIRNEDNDAWIKFAELDQANDKFVLSGTLQLDDGTVSAPALTFNSDTNMGIYRGGTDILKFVTAGTDAITINASQNVGIGTSSPTFSSGGGVHNKGSSGAFTSYRASVDSNTGIDFAQGADGKGYIYNRDNADLIIATNNTERMRITSAGDVGIGASPSHKLEVHSANATNIVAKSTNGNGGFLNYSGLSSGGTTTFSVTHNGRVFAEDGIQFDSSGEALNSYEEGSYDVSVTASTSGTITLNSSFNSASYTKIGNLVHVSGLLGMSSVSSPVGYTKITLPFTVANLAERQGDTNAVVYITGVASVNVADFVATVNQNTNFIIVQRGDNVSPQNTSAEQIQASSTIAFSVTYKTA